MANETRSSQKDKDDDRKSLKVRQGSGSSTMDSSGLRRSTRETSCKKLLSTSCTGKSNRHDKRAPATSPVKGKSAKVELQLTPSPLRRSERGNKFHPDKVSGSKNPSSSSDVKRKQKVEKQVSKSVHMTNARAYRSSFQPKKVDIAGDDEQYAAHVPQHVSSSILLSDLEEDLDGPNSMCNGVFESNSDEDNKSPETDLKEDKYEPRENSLVLSTPSTRKFAKETTESKGEAEFLSSSHNHRITVEAVEFQGGDDLQVPKGDANLSLSAPGPLNGENSDDAEQAQAGREKMQTTSKERFLDGKTVDLGGGQANSRKSERNDSSKSSDASAAFGSKDIANGVSSSPADIQKGNHVEVSAHYKRQRLHKDSPKQGVCGIPKKIEQLQSSASMDKGTIDASVSTEFSGKLGTDEQQKLNVDNNTCFICEIGGKLLCCDGKGCRRSFHGSCVDPPLNEVPTGLWYCFWCCSKKIKLGVHCMSEGIESIWDSRELEVPDVQGGPVPQREKQYFVKHKGLAHVHNTWVPESQLLLEAPLLLAKFNRKNQVTRWKKEWIVPQRLLQKRLLMVPKSGSEGIDAGHNGSCLHEWLVKWRGLDYEQITWELECASFMASSEAQKLMEEYELRHRNAKNASVPCQKQTERKDCVTKLSKFPGGDLAGSDANYLQSINKLRDYWLKCHNCAVVDDQDRIAKIVLFILSLQSGVSQPFLIISTTAALMLWETEFCNLAPSMSAIVYSGSKEAREVIRKLEFCGDGGFPMFQVLLSTPEAIILDLEAIKLLKWEAVIIDDCPRSRMSSYYEHFKLLLTNMKLVLISGQSKDSVPEYLSLLSFLGPDDDTKTSNGMKADSGEALSKLRERLSPFIAYTYKTESSKFVEYWVPVQLSCVQLEQYCSILLSNCTALRSSSRSDLVGVLRDIVVSTRKCCDHPYNANPNVQTVITNGLDGVEILNIGIKASGKLQVLDIILPKIKEQGLRALIVFQSNAGSVSIGDILDDFVRLRFGENSYERVDSVGLIPSKKQAALNMFNSKDSGRFIFLLEHRACLPSIKLTSVDIVIIYNSDMNPSNDIRSLQKLSIDSQNEQIKVFRLYSPCTVEEKVLLLPKHDINLDSSLQSLSRSTSHMLLMWGASFLFKKLDEFHSSDAQSFEVNLTSELSLFTNSVQELLALLIQKTDSCDNTSSIKKVQQNRGTYGRYISLPGELEVQLTDEKQPHMFWAQLLDGRPPHWKYISQPSQRNRKRVQYADDISEQAEYESAHVVKKRKKVDKGNLLSTDTEYNGSQSLPKSAAFVDQPMDTECASELPLLDKDVPVVAEIGMVDSEPDSLRDAQKSLHLCLKPELSKLCEVLQFSEDTKLMVERFLEYVMNNYHVSREPESILQAFQISLCWVAASNLKHKIDRRKSLALARQHLGFSCIEEEVDSIYSRLRCMKKLVSRTDYLREHNVHYDAKSTVIDVSDSMHECTQETMEADKCLASETSSGNLSPIQQEQTAEVSNKHNQPKHNEQMKKLLQEQQDEVRKFREACIEKKLGLENWRNVELGFIRSMYSHIPVRTDKLRILDKIYAEKLEETENRNTVDFRELEAKHLAAINDLKQKEVHSQPSLQIETIGKSSLQHTTENIIMSEKVIAPDFLGNDVTSRHLVGEHEIPGSFPSTDVIARTSDVADPDKTSDVADPDETLASNIRCNEIVGGNQLQISTLSQTTDPGVMKHNKGGNSPCDVSLARFTSSEELSYGGGILGMAVRDVPADASDKADDKVTKDDTLLENSNHFMNLNRENQPSDKPIGIDSTSNNKHSDVNVPVVQTDDEAVLDMAVGPVPSEVSDNSCGRERLLIDGPTIVAECNREIAAVVDRQILKSVQNNGDGPIDGDSLTLKLSQVNCSEQNVEVVPPLFQTPQNDCSRSSADIQVALQNECSPSSADIQGALHNECSRSPEDVQVALQNECTPSSGDIQGALHNECSQSPADVQVAVQTVFSWSSADIQVNGASNLEQIVAFDSNGYPAEGSVLQLQPIQSADLPSHQTEAGLSPTVALVGNRTESSNQPALESERQPLAVPPSGFDIPISVTRIPSTTIESRNNSAQSTPPTLTLVPPALYPDPLQNELERLRREIEKTNKMHEDMKTQLKSDYDKEMEELHKKYEIRQQQVQTAFAQKKKELDSNCNKVQMNKILAEAFRFKCMDIRPSGAPRMLQATSGFMQHLIQLSTQESAQRTYAAGQSSASLSAVSMQTVSMPVQVVHNPAQLFSNTPPRPPQIISPSPAAGNHQVGSEFRSPAPHLQPFRPSTSLPATSPLSVPRGVACQQIPNMPTSSDSQVPPRPIQPLPPPPGYQSAACNLPHQPESAVGLPSLENSSLSAAAPRSLLPPLQYLGANFNSWDLSQFGIPGNLHVSSTTPGVDTEIVCLSDDD